MLADLGACFCSTRREAPHEARRLQRPVAWMLDRAVELTEVRGQVVDPVRSNPVSAHRLVLEPDVLALLHVRREPQAADARKAVARQSFHAVERALRPLPETSRLVDAVGVARNVVAAGAPAKREAPVAPARPLRHSALVVPPHPEARLCEPKGSRAAGDSCP